MIPKIKYSKERFALIWRWNGYRYSFFSGFGRRYLVRSKRGEFNWISLDWKRAGEQTEKSKMSVLLSYFLKDIQCPACGRWGSKKPHDSTCRLIQFFPDKYAENKKLLWQVSEQARAKQGLPSLGSYKVE